MAALRRSGLANARLARAWLAAGDSALQRPVAVTLPFQETGYFAAGDADAIAYLLPVRRGQRLVVQLDSATRGGGRLFTDLFAAPAGGVRPGSLDSVRDTTERVAPERAPERVASLQDSALQLTYEVRRDGPLVLRLQPELLAAMRYTITVRTEPSLAFPVSGADSRDVQSVFGAERDGGRRSHEGVDIFVPRGTPAVAAAAGVVGGNQRNNLGGKVVWIADAEDRAGLYYAHLDSQLVQPGQRVRPGDTVGLVGNTGNARTTVPQLHFGIYVQGAGAVNPYWYIAPPRGELEPPSASLARLGERVRVRRSTVLRGVAAFPAAAATADSAARTSRRGAGQALPLARETTMRVAGVARDDYRVRLPDGTAGYVAARVVEPTTEPLRTVRLAAGTALRDLPTPAGIVMGALPSDSALPIYGRFAGALLVRGPLGRRAWVALPP